MKIIETTILESQLNILDKYLMIFIHSSKDAENEREHLSYLIKANYLSEVMNYTEEILASIECGLSGTHDIDLYELIDCYKRVIRLIRDEGAIEQHILDVLASQAFYIQSLPMKEPDLEVAFIDFYNRYATVFLDKSAIDKFDEYQGDYQLYDYEQDVKRYLCDDHELSELIEKRENHGIYHNMELIQHLNQRLLDILGN